MTQIGVHCFAARYCQKSSTQNSSVDAQSCSFEKLQPYEGIEGVQYARRDDDFR